MMTLYKALEQYDLVSYTTLVTQIMGYLRTSRVDLIKLQSYFLVPGKLETALRAYRILPKNTAAEKYAYLNSMTTDEQQDETPKKGIFSKLQKQDATAITWCIEEAEQRG